MTDDLVPGRLLTEVSYGDPGSVDPSDLVSLLDHPEPETRRAGAETLARMGASTPGRLEPYTPDLESHLRTDDERVRAHLLCALASVARVNPSAVTATSQVLDALEADDPQVREWAALLLAYVGGTPGGERRMAIDRLAALLADDHPTVRRNACLGLAGLDAEAADAVRPLLDDPDEAVRETAAQVVELLD
ncbi:MAG: HEAT repeat domain-containing protein [Haloarculaceae archaeon]